MKRLKKALRRLVGKIVSRLQSYGEQYREADRQRLISEKCRVDTSACIDVKAGFANGTGDPDRMTIGPFSLICGELIVHPLGGCIKIGKRCFLGPGSRVWSSASVTIGDYVLMSHNVNIHDNISHSLDWRERRTEIDRVLPYATLYAHDFDIKSSPLVIEDDVWIGFGATILGGVKIGRGAIIGAGTMVTKDVAPFTVVVGNPMRVIKLLNDRGVSDAVET